MPKSSIAKRSIVFNGHKTSVSLENEFWNALKEIAGKRAIHLSDLVAEINDSVGMATFRLPFGSSCSITIKTPRRMPSEIGATNDGAEHWSISQR
jgi:predicted DNA-binding ribbon-helix-helix protein